MIIYNKYIEETLPPPTVALADRVRQMKLAGTKIIGLQTGDPDFSTPSIITEAVHSAIIQGHTHYCDSKGTPSLRRSISEKCKSFNRLEYHPDEEILVTNGGIHGYYCTIKSLFNEGDEILIPDPTWPTHFNVISVCGVRPILIPADDENHFCPTISAWQKAITPRTKAIVINYPSNPTGAMPEKKYLSELAQFAIDHDLIVISDEVYEHIVFDGLKAIHFASLPGMKSRTITIFSASKSYAMTGWRLGYITAPKHIISRIQKMSQFTVTNVSTFVQEGFASVMNDPLLLKEVEKMRDAYEQRRNFAVSILNKQSVIKFRNPEGAFYFFLDFSELGMSSLKLAEQLISEAGVAMVPGEAYGNKGKGFLRMTIAASPEEIKSGLEKTVSWALKVEKQNYA